MNNNLPQTALEYIICFRQLSAITNTAMDFVENDTSTDMSSLGRLAENVETIASLRGDSGIYANSRPVGLIEYQKEMYATEYAMRDRLLALGYVYPTR